MSYNTFEDARSYEDGALLSTDLCIIGAGAAGLTLAQKLAPTGLRICLLEAGGLNPETVVERMSPTFSDGREYPASATRMRQFGGTTNHWGGHCVPFEPSDLEKRDWLGHVEWPFSYDKLLSYYGQAAALLGIGEHDFDPAPVFERLGESMIDLDSRIMKTQLSRYNRFRFGLAFGEMLDNSANIQVVLHADVSELLLGEDTGNDVREVVFTSSAGGHHRVVAKRVVLAAGGIETPRILLMSNRQRTAGLGNSNDLVGRYFCEHLNYPSGQMVLSGNAKLPRVYFEETPFENIHVRSHLVMPAETSQELRLPRFRAELRAANLPFEILNSRRRKSIDPADLLYLISRPHSLGSAIRCRRDGTPDSYTLINYVEQTPNRESRVTLSSERDSVGRPATLVQWRLSRIDHENIVTVHSLLARDLGSQNLGRFRMEIETDPEVILEGVSGGSHHMGTTRMANDPKFGVTNSDGRVHFIQNLYVAGSGLFPSGSYPNPTYTIVAMTLRLADHLENLFRKERVIR